jgi:hypothetical protein
MDYTKSTTAAYDIFGDGRDARSQQFMGKITRYLDANGYVAATVIGEIGCNIGLGYPSGNGYTDSVEHGNPTGIMGGAAFVAAERKMCCNVAYVSLRMVLVIPSRYFSFQHYLVHGISCTYKRCCLGRKL